MDKIVVFKPLGSAQLTEVLDIELRMVQQRILNALPEGPFQFQLTGAAKGLLLKEGTDVRYGARHLKRAIERLLVQPVSNLIASGQVHGGDCIRVDWQSTLDRFTFVKQWEGEPYPSMSETPGRSIAARAQTAGKGIPFNTAKGQARCPGWVDGGMARSTVNEFLP